MYLEDCGLQRSDVVKHRVVARVITVESESKAAHVELALREVLNARRLDALVREAL